MTYKSFSYHITQGTIVMSPPNRDHVDIRLCMYIYNGAIFRCNVMLSVRQGRPVGKKEDCSA